MKICGCLGTKEGNELKEIDGLEFETSDLESFVDIIKSAKENDRTIHINYVTDDDDNDCCDIEDVWLEVNK